MNAFEGYSEYYDLLYADKDYLAETNYITALLRAALPDHATQLLEFGSGTGRHGRLLAERGFTVLGIENSQTMVSSATANGKDQRPNERFTCMLGDIRTTDAGRKTDAVLSLFHVINYQATNECLIQTFANAAHHLHPNGVFLFDTWHGPAVLKHRPSVRIKRAENERMRIIRIAEPAMDTNAGIVTVRFTIVADSVTSGRLNTLTEEHHMRYLFPTEIGLLARQTGFEIERTEEFLTGAQPSEDTWNVMYVLRNTQ